MLKKLPFLLVLAALTVFSSCKKDEEGDGGTSLSDNQWKVGETTFTASSLIGSAWDNAKNQLGSATDGITSLITVKFASKPTANGTYVVKDAATTPTPAAGECTVTIVTASPAESYTSTGKSGNTVTVTVNSGKIGVSFSNIEVLALSGATNTSASGKLIEK